MLVYATEADLTAGNWLDVAAPANVASLLRSASILVARAINESLHSPSTITTEPRRDATCAQVATWVAAGVTPASAGISTAPLVKSKSLDGAQIDYDTSLNASVTAFQKREQIAEHLSAQAEAILYSAGLLYAPLPVWSETPDQGQYVNEFGVVGGNAGFSGVIF